MPDTLFIGNSYTAGIQPTLQRIVAASPHRDATLGFVHVGGITLRQLIDRGLAGKAIERRPWDIVVLQEQSQLPALDREHRTMFDEAVDELTEMTRAAGGEPMLYMTWGRRDRDEANPDLLPDFDTMQRRLSAAYRAAAERCSARLAPVGEAWAKVRQTNADLGRRLYQDDGSHASAEGALLGASVFYRALFNGQLDDVPTPEEITAEDAVVIKRAVLELESP